MTWGVNAYGRRNRSGPIRSISGAVRECRRGITFAFAAIVKMLLASIALSALVLWALGCSGVRV